MRQVLIEIPMLWIAGLLAVAGLGALLVGLVTRNRETVVTGAIITAVVVIAGALFWDQLDERRLPIFGFGFLLFLSFLAASGMVRRMARREGLDPERLTDMGLWIFICGIIGARLLFMLRNPEQFDSPLAFLKIWQGGIVFYGGVAAGVMVFLYYTKRYLLPPFQVLDAVAPAVAVGIAVGRFGCLLNGCCWGAPTDVPWAITFPYGSIPHVEQLSKHADRVSLGFYISNQAGDPPVIQAIDGDSWADAAGLKNGDLVRRVNGRDVTRREAGREYHDAPALLGLITQFAEPGSDITFEIDRGGHIMNQNGTLTPTPPHSIPVHPTQVYLGLAGAALVALTLGYYPVRKRPGEVMALMMIGYAVSRFVIEQYRDDEPAWIAGMTLSQSASIVLFAGGIVLFAWLRHQPLASPRVPAKV